MKNLFLSLLLIVSVQAFSQNVFERKVSFEYLQRPLQPLKSSIKNYQASVVMEYTADVQARKDAFAKLVLDYEKKYNDDMAAYDKAVKDAGVKYAHEMVEYNKLILNPANANMPKPVLTLPQKPEKFIPVDNTYYPKTFNTQSMATTYIKLDGYNNAPDNAAAISVLMKGFQYTEPELKIADKKTKNKDGIEIIEKEYWFEFNYKHPMGLKVEVPGSGVVFFEYFEDLNRYSVYRTERFKSEAEARAAFNRDNIFNGLDDKMAIDNIKYVNNAMNSRFGLTRVTATENIFLVEAKKKSKFTYTDFQQAFETALTGLNQLSADINRTVAAQNISSGIGIWENTLKESQPANKKARINGDVTMAALFNVALMSIYADDYIKAEIYLNKVLSTDASKREQRRVEQIRAFLRDQQKRYEAFKAQN